MNYFKLEILNVFLHNFINLKKKQCHNLITNNPNYEFDILISELI